MIIRKITAREFRDAGFLQEVNRQFLHPLGLALEVVIDDNGKVRFGDVWDYRDDPEGMMYLESDIVSDEFIEKADAVTKLMDEKARVRQGRFGWVVQPTGR